MMATPFERMKAAWSSSDREGELNRVVETMAVEGATRDELDNALGFLLDEVRSAEASDDAEEIIASIGDRLHGWCHASRQINTGVLSLPTDEDIAKLPRWFRVAFAARCIRRLLPLLAFAPTASEASQQLIEVVNATERSAVEGSGEQMLEPWGNALRASKAFQDLGLTLQAAIATTAYRAALLAWDEGHMTLPEPGVFYKSSSPTAWEQSFEVGQAVGIGRELADAIDADYHLLRRLSSEGKWSEAAPIPPDFLNIPLWPRGEPQLDRKRND